MRPWRWRGGPRRRRTASRMCGEHDTTVPGNAVHRSSPRNIAGWAVFRTRIVRGFPRWGLLPMSPSARLPSCHRNTWLDTRRRPWFDWPGRMCGPGRAGVRPRRAHRTMTVSAYPAAKETARPSGHHRRRRPAHPEHRLLLPGHQQPPRRCHRSLHHPTRRPDHHPPGHPRQLTHLPAGSR